MFGHLKDAEAIFTPQNPILFHTFVSTFKLKYAAPSV